MCVDISRASQTEMLLPLSTSNPAFIMCSSRRYDVASWIESDITRGKALCRCNALPGHDEYHVLAYQPADGRIAAMRQLRLGVNLVPP